MNPSWTVTIHGDIQITPPPPPAWTPADIPGLQIWLKADAGTYQNSALTTPAVADGAPVGGWVDQSGRGNTVVQASAPDKPELKVAALNGLPVVRFNGSSDVLATAGPVIHGIGTGDFYFAAVVNTGASVNGFFTVFSNGAYSPAVYVYDASLDYYDSGGDHRSATVLTVSTPYLFEIWRSAGVVYLAVNGVTDPNTYALPTSWPSAVWNVGEDPLNEPWNGDVGEMLVVAGGGGLAQQSQLRAYMLGRWGVG